MERNQQAGRGGARLAAKRGVKLDWLRTRAITTRSSHATGPTIGGICTPMGNAACRETQMVQWSGAALSRSGCKWQTGSIIATSSKTILLAIEILLTRTGLHGFDVLGMRDSVEALRPRPTNKVYPVWRTRGDSRRVGAPFSPRSLRLEWDRVFQRWETIAFIEY